MYRDVILILCHPSCKHVGMLSFKAIREVSAVLYGLDWREVLSRQGKGRKGTFGVYTSKPQNTQHA